MPAVPYGMRTSDEYELLRTLASPLLAVTSAYQGKGNGMVLDSAARASISPEVPRLSVYIHKWHLSHEYIWATGRFVAHLLHQGQMDLVYRLGFVSGREADKLAAIPHNADRGVPVLDEHVAAFVCRVANTMDAGASTCFLADIEETVPGRAGEVLTAPYFRAHLPEERRAAFLRNYRDSQDRILQLRTIQDVRPWGT